MRIGNFFPDGKGQRKSGKKLIDRKNELKAAAGKPTQPPKDLVAPGRPIILNRRTGKPQLRGGQPSLVARRNVDPLIVQNLASAGLPDSEIAAQISCDVRTLRKHFLPFLERGHTRFRATLRRLVYKLALEGCWPALKFLLFNYCGMIDPAGERGSSQMVKTPSTPRTNPTINLNVRHGRTG